MKMHDFEDEDGQYLENTQKVVVETLLESNSEPENLRLWKDRQPSEKVKQAVSKMRSSTKGSEPWREARKERRQLEAERRDRRQREAWKKMSTSKVGGSTAAGHVVVQNEKTYDQEKLRSDSGLGVRRGMRTKATRSLPSRIEDASGT